MGGGDMSHRSLSDEIGLFRIHTVALATRTGWLSSARGKPDQLPSDVVQLLGNFKDELMGKKRRLSISGLAGAYQPFAGMVDLKMTTALKSGAFHHEIHYWLGKDTSQDEAGAAAIKTVELDASLGGRAVQYRELQGHETDKFLSYFKPCIIPQQGGVASGFKHTEVNEQEHQTRLYVCKGKHVVHVKEITFSRASLNHDDIFILDTKSKIFQFNGSNSSIQERAKALEVVQYIKYTYHDGKCEVAAVEDGKLMSDADAGEFWGFFGGFAPLPRKTTFDDNRNVEALPPKLLCVEKEQPVPVEADSLTRELLDTSKCYLLDCGIEMFVWIGRSTSLEERKSASVAAEEILRGPDRPKAHVIRVIEGFETVVFRSKFDSWLQTTEVTVSEDGRGKVAALLKRQGLNVKGLTKAIPVKEEPQPYIDCTGNLQHVLVALQINMGNVTTECKYNGVHTGMDLEWQKGQWKGWTGLCGSNPLYSMPCRGEHWMVRRKTGITCATSVFRGEYWTIFPSPFYLPSLLSFAHIFGISCFYLLTVHVVGLSCSDPSPKRTWIGEGDNNWEHLVWGSKRLRREV